LSKWAAQKGKSPQALLVQPHSCLKNFALNARMRHDDRMDTKNIVGRNLTSNLSRKISDITTRDIAWIITGMLFLFATTQRTAQISRRLVYQVEFDPKKLDLKI